jgi:hypothetical protein
MSFIVDLFERSEPFEKYAAKKVPTFTEMKDGIFKTGRKKP